MFEKTWWAFIWAGPFNLYGPLLGRATCRRIIGASCPMNGWHLSQQWANTCFLRPMRILHVENPHWSGPLVGYRIQNQTQQLNGDPLRWMPRVGHPWRKHFHDVPFIVMEVDTSVMIILVMSWNTSTTAQVWLSWFYHKIVMDVHAWQKTWPTVTNTYHHGSVFFCSVLSIGFLNYWFDLISHNLICWVVN